MCLPAAKVREKDMDSGARCYCISTLPGMIMDIDEMLPLGQEPSV